ncbi:MAG: hypothetical protein A2Z25_00675 [Planctomycetes bacterium RBG_16_55_9]|nr:MAG: hypothetical protein A2Z25_00675 [Planctomycetes bacterium RBG_16_55_9]
MLFILTFCLFYTDNTTDTYVDRFPEIIEIMRTKFIQEKTDFLDFGHQHFGLLYAVQNRRNKLFLFHALIMSIILSSTFVWETKDRCKEVNIPGGGYLLLREYRRLQLLELTGQIDLTNNSCPWNITFPLG